MSRIEELAAEIHAIPDLAAIEIQLVDAPPGDVYDPKKIEIDLGPVVISVFGKNGPYAMGKDFKILSGWHYAFSTYTHDHQSAAEGGWAKYKPQIGSSPTSGRCLNASPSNEDSPNISSVGSVGLTVQLSAAIALIRSATRCLICRFPDNQYRTVRGLTRERHRQLRLPAPGRRASRRCCGVRRGHFFASFRAALLSASISSSVGIARNHLRFRNSAAISDAVSHAR